MINSIVPVFRTFTVAFQFGEIRERLQYENLERYGEVAKIRKRYCIQQNDKATLLQLKLNIVLF